MEWGESDVWTCELLGESAGAEFKIVQVDGSGNPVEWEPGSNRRATSEELQTLSLSLEWGRQGYGGSQSAGARGLEAEGAASASGGEAPLTKARLEAADAARQWVGSAPSFMRSNEHSRERRGRWDSSSVQGAARFLVERDAESPSWLHKLQALKELLVDQPERARPELDAVAAAFVYAQWIATGAVPCVEGGGHHRPCHHATLSRDIFQSLEWAVAQALEGVGARQASEADDASTSLAVFARKLQGRLPSFQSEFVQSTPLTSIRDIAHRNDIPQDLKLEIKHTIQNKLHRNAGPEDLIASEAMLARVTHSPGEYEASFVAAFQSFVSELRDFFNAGSLDRALAALLPGLDEAEQQAVQLLQQRTRALVSLGADAPLQPITDALHAATSVRALLLRGLGSGLRDDAPPAALARRQQWRLCELRAEDHAFALLSQFSGALDKAGGAAALAGGSDADWALPLGATVLALRQMGLGGFRPAECAAVERELELWQKQGHFADGEHALRLRATLQRAVRLAEAFSACMLRALATRSATMGRALGISEEQSSVFAEAEIRASCAFSLSKLASALSAATRAVVGDQGWDVVVPGTAAGVLREVGTLSREHLSGKEPCIALVTRATGDEEVAALRPALRGIVLAHDIPLLSHLGVRARQEGTPLVCTDVAGLVDGEVRPLLGKTVVLEALPGGVTLRKGSDVETSSAAAERKQPPSRSASAPALATTLAKKLQVLPLHSSPASDVGAKAAACGRLLTLARASAERAEESSLTVFLAPAGVAVPFGCMEAAIERSGLGKAYAAAVEQATSPDAGAEETARACATLRRLVQDGVELPESFLFEIARSVAEEEGRQDHRRSTEDGTLAVRSSSNVEDLEGLSGAGLYESVVGVPACDPEALQRAVLSVWASLWSVRATMSRQAAGLAPTSARMALLIQRALEPEMSFVLHTANPVDGSPDTLAAEMAPGLGETLAAATRGTAWRLEVQKSGVEEGLRALAAARRAGGPQDDARVAALCAPGQSAVKTVSFANFSHALELRRGAVLVDYSEQAMSGLRRARYETGMRLAGIGKGLEKAFGCALDIEGCVAQGRIAIVQARPQPL